MTAQETIPIVVGVTGHRDIRDEDRDVLSKVVYRELSALLKLGTESFETFDLTYYSAENMWTVPRADIGPEEVSET